MVAKPWRKSELVATPNGADTPSAAKTPPSVIPEALESVSCSPAITALPPAGWKIPATFSRLLAAVESVLVAVASDPLAKTS